MGREASKSYKLADHSQLQIAQLYAYALRAGFALKHISDDVPASLKLLHEHHVKLTLPPLFRMQGLFLACSGPIFGRLENVAAIGVSEDQELDWLLRAATEETKRRGRPMPMAEASPTNTPQRQWRRVDGPGAG